VIKMMFITMLNHYGGATVEEYEAICRTGIQSHVENVPRVSAGSLVLKDQVGLE